MREIKFRMWCITKKEWESDLWWIGCDGNLYTCREGQLMGLNKDHHVIMQYIGLKDKNGVEIYENDLVKIHNGELMIIVFGEIAPFFIFKEINGLEYYPGFEDYAGLEVIGNVYENPELMVFN